MKRHPTDVISLIFGLIFVGIAGWWLVARVSSIALPVGWVVAIALVVIGTIGLVAAIRPGRRDPDPDQTDPTQPPGSA
jgi:uncharacterized membrane protein HdeD (DUF308 family)